MFPLKGGGVRLKIPGHGSKFQERFLTACSMSPGQGFVFGLQLPFDGQGARFCPFQKVVHFHSQPSDQPQPLCVSAENLFFVSILVLGCKFPGRSITVINSNCSCFRFEKFMHKSLSRYYEPFTVFQLLASGQC